MKRVLRLACYAWVAPATAVGLVGGLLAWSGGASVRVVDGVVEVGGGRLAGWVGKLPMSVRFDAITFGHVVLGVTQTALGALRAHERVHVRQVRAVGVTFFPALPGFELGALAARRGSVPGQLFRAGSLRAVCVFPSPVAARSAMTIATVIA